LQAIGLRDELAHSSIRFGLGRGNTADEVDFVAGEVIENVRRLRALSPRYEMAIEESGLNAVQWGASDS
jgi:cysteine desulfurase